MASNWCREKIKEVCNLSSSTFWLSKPQIIALLLGQLASLLITGTGITSQILAANYTISIPTSQSFLNYVLLFLVYGAVLVYQEGFEKFFENLIWKALIYFPLALFDVEGNYLVVKAYKYTTIASIMLLDSFTIPCVTLLTLFFLNTKYNIRHYFGILLCLVGNVVVIYSDVRSSDSPNALLGDFLCIGGAILYSLSNVGSEKYIKQFNQIEYLTYLGFWGTFISLIQILILERTEISNLSLTYDSILLLVGFSLCMFVLYSIVPMTLTYGGATLYNLSLLTSDIYAVLSSIIIFHNFPNYLFYVSLVFVMGGLLVYSLKNDVNIEIINEEDKESETTEFIHHIEVRNDIEEEESYQQRDRTEGRQNVIEEEESNLLEHQTK